MILKGWNELWIGPEFFSGPNLIVDTGFPLAAAVFAGTDDITHLGMGSDPGESTADMIALQAEVSTRQALVKTSAGARILFDYEFTTVAPLTLAEFGLFNALTDGILFARWTITPFVTPTGTTIKGRWYITLGSVG
jgi:hypothetical protein